jgi:hypothetical protein
MIVSAAKPKQGNTETCCGRVEIPTFGGTAGGEKCAFPFEFEGVEYDGCIMGKLGQPWCATRPGDFNTHGKWGNCKFPCVIAIGARTYGGNAHGASCVFPFTYDGVQYYGCTSVGQDPLWCATELGEPYRWGYCDCPSSGQDTIHAQLKVSSTCNGTAKGSACVFPFMYKGMVFTGCTTIESDDNRKWCGTKTGEVLSHGQWGYCECEKKEVSTCGGTANGEACVFPFTYEGVEYDDCTMVEHDQPWCLTRPGLFDGHDKWGNCYCWSHLTIGQRTCGGTAHGASCVFPFTYKGVEYHACTSVDHDQRWCKTRSWQNYTWGNCDCPMSSATEYVPETCDDIDGTAKGSACVFPFTYYGMVFNGCTTFESYGEPWCATESGEVEMHDKWGYCECTIVSHGNVECEFPFVSNSVAYYDCIGSPGWCVVNSTRYNCACSPVGSQTCPRPVNGKQDCVFPFKYKGVKYYNCAYVEGNLKCPTKVDKKMRYKGWVPCEQ